MLPKSKLQPIPSAVELNRDVESLLVQAASGRSVFFRDQYKPLTFAHNSDAHAVSETWDRMVEYINYYADFIDFCLHTGD